MSQTSRLPMSGLRSVKRDFSSNALGPMSQDSYRTDATTIPWSEATSSRTLSGMEKRLKDIQDALNGNTSTSKAALSSSNSQNLRSNLLQKRPSDSQDPPAKRRQLPPGWDTPAHTSAKLQKSSSSFNLAAVNSGSAIMPKPGKSAPIHLSSEQKYILNLVEKGESIFYTGSAGTGKSVLLKEIIAVLRRRYNKLLDAVAVTASTGIAACNIGGVTIHSFAGIGLGQEPVPELLRRIRKNKKAMSRWLRTKVLIVDEVSMMEADLFDKLADIGKELRKGGVPFGGIQVVVTGDFFQLPPVMKSSNVKFAFEANNWPQVIKKTFNLTQVFRQRDEEFVNMLNEMRFGRLTSTSISRFKSLTREIVYEDGLGATELFPLRQDVDRSNNARINGISGETHTFRAYDGGTIVDETQRTKMLGNFMAQQTLTLKVGAQVMLIKNIDDTLVNGSMGKVVSFADPADYTVLQDVETTAKAADGKPVSEAGPGASASANAKAGGKGAVATSMARLLPVIDFLIPGGGMRRMIVQPEIFKVELPDGEVQVSRTQLPLILAWAMSIHKSQGQTLERVKVDLAKVFEKGQAYVALSRATSLEGLQVLNFDHRKVQAHEKVIGWSRTLSTIPDA